MVTKMNRLENAARLAMADHRVPAAHTQPPAPQRVLSLRAILVSAVAATAAVLLALGLF